MSVGRERGGGRKAEGGYVSEREEGERLCQRHGEKKVLKRQKRVGEKERREREKKNYY